MGTRKVNTSHTDVTFFDNYVSFCVEGVRYLISTCDVDILDKYRWYVHKQRPNTPYLYSTKSQFIHRVIMNPPKEMTVDHINGDVTDNRRENLRLCTVGQNAKNRGMRKDNTTGYKGVYVKKRDSRFVAQIKCDGRSKHLGYFDTAEEAYKVYCEAELKYFGEYARKNGGGE